MADILKSIIKPVELVFIQETGEPREFRISEDTVLKRSNFFEKQKNGVLQLKVKALSGTQGKFTHKLGEWYYTNLSKAVKTTINNEVLKAGEERELKDKDVLSIEGETRVLIGFFYEYSNEIEWTKIALDGTQQLIHVYSHEEGETEVSSELDPEKKHHALLTFKDNAWYVQDVNTDRGVFINQEKVDGEHKIELFDTVCIGDTVFFCQKDRLIYNKKTLARNSLSIHIEERTAWNFMKKHVLLKDIDVNIKPGSLVLILGGSGAGKTTFVNAVTGYEKAKARIMEGRLNVYQNYDRMKYEIGFVPQQDLLRGDDTVTMTLMNAAQLRMPEGTTDAERESRVKEVTEMFGLGEVKSELVSKLSGGQRKRLSIGIEFVSDPSLFILDEPDSGLDGVMAKELMERLRTVADQQKIVMVITHTPDRVLDLFDHIIVLAKDKKHVGQLAFYGTIDEAKAFFDKKTMEEVVLAINPIDAGGEGRADEFIQKYKEYRETQKN